uniref:ornithine decarboxylase n=1 Tax=Candidatus Kentrum sp. LPFa TaxID=2126335 RepID=A0A450WYG8_9GAMM|nr:MAG: ornithine decarboxylase [Candidatus Kentron sp. LPFa]
MDFAELQRIKAPCWLFDPDIAVANYQRLVTLFENATVAYAVKSNPHPAFLSRLAEVGAHFCVVSRAHIEELLALGVEQQRMVYSHPVKSLDAIGFACRSNVLRFACDSPAEIDKIAGFDTSAEIFIRLRVDNSGSMVKLSDKFGVMPKTALDLMHYAAWRGLKPIGFTFHVGSQCLRLENWSEAIRTVGSVWEQARKLFGIDFINLSGGFPTLYDDDTSLFDLENIAALIQQNIKRYLPGTQRIILEPGRAISATAGALLASVIGIARRPDGYTWLFIDAGFFSGLFETIDGICYPVKVVSILDSGLFHGIRQKSLNQPNGDGEYTYMLAGPTCDAIDKLFTLTTSKAISIGDRLLFQHTGAYSYSMESSFNGFDAPSVEIVSLSELI